MTGAIGHMRQRLDPWLIGVILLYIALAATYTFLALWRYDIFRAGIDDGAFTQIVHTAFGGFSSSVESGANHLLVHFSPILILAVPFVELFHGARGLAILQALVTAGIVFPIWAMARTRFSKPVAFAATLIVACYPPLSAEGVGDFHELAFAPLLTACLVLAIDRRAWRYAIGLALVLVCVKEDQFVSVAFVGVLVAFMGRADRPQRCCGLWMAAIGIIAAVLYFGVIRRAIDPTFPYWSMHFYQWWWYPPTAGGFVPWDSLARPMYLVAILAPLAFLPLGSRYVWFALPGLAEVLLSHEGITMALNTHYSATWSGYLLCAFVDGAYALSRLSPYATKALMVAAIAISIWTSQNQSPIAPGFALYRLPDGEDAARERILQALPARATVWGHDPIFAHLSMNSNASPNMDGQDYLIFDLSQDAAQYASAPIQQLVTSGTYVVVGSEDGLTILRKRR
jgi:uncharacterized membrane protein